MIDTAWQDLRFSLRALRRRSGTTLTIVLVLALAIGATSSLFSVVDTVLLKPLPFDDSERLVMLLNRYGTTETALSPPDYIDRRDRSQLLTGTAAIRPNMPLNLSGPNGKPNGKKVRAAAVTSELFSVLGVEPQLGRILFNPEESAETTRVAVLSHGLWQLHFGGDTTVLGREVELHGHQYTVLAVMNQDFDFPRGTEVWVPLYFTPSQLADDNRGNESLLSIGRYAEETNIEQVRAEMENIAASVVERDPERASFLTQSGWGASTTPLNDYLFGPVRPALWALLAAVALVLLIACANVANILLAGTVERSRELALRSSLGASRSRLVRQLLCESVVLSVAGCVGGLGLALLFLGHGLAWIPHDVPRLDEVTLDLRVLSFTVLVSVVTAVLFGSLPAWLGSSARPRSFLQITGSLGAKRWARALVVGETALACVLLVGAGLLLRSLVALQAVETGFEPDQRLTFRVVLPPDDYPDSEDQTAFQDAFLERLRALPGVLSAAVSDRVPLDQQRWTGTFRVIGHTDEPGERPPGAQLVSAGPQFFATLGIPIQEGREFLPSDAAGNRVVVVDSLTAKRFWPQSSALGERIYFSSPERSYEIVGVAKHVRQESLAEQEDMQIYLASNQIAIDDMVFALRSAGDPEPLLGAIRHELGEIAPGLPLSDVQTMDRLLSRSASLPRFNLLVLGGFSLLATVLAALGLYGVLARSVSQRTAEIGTRMALGASNASVLLLIVREGLKMTLLGLLAGLLGAVALARYLSSLLFGVESTDPLTYLSIAALLGLVALFATYLPARRAARLEPIRALRNE